MGDLTFIYEVNMEITNLFQTVVALLAILVEQLEVLPPHT
jgi:hypothetical protein